MATARHMPLKDCYAILDLSIEATLEDIKHAYRRRAFELHPDLHPGNPNASLQFQRLNEAYVVLSRVLTHDEEKCANTTPEEPPHAPKAEFRAQSATQESTGKRDTGQYGGKSTTEDPHTDTSEQATAHQGTQQNDTDEARRKRSAQSAYASQENVLNDILNDPFARRVFEDIYSEVNKKQKTVAAPKLAAEPQSLQNRQNRQNPFEGGENSFTDLTHGIKGVLRNWLRSQIDEIQTMRFPVAHLFPGARLRFQIRRGLSNELSTVEITLPKDFVIGKPVRLRGMGRRVGPWQGDLYLKLLVREAAPKPS